MGCEAIKSQQPEMAEQRPRRALFSANLQNAGERDAGLEAVARPIKAEDRLHVFELLRAVAILAPPNAVYATDWVHRNASFWLRRTKAEKEAVAYNDEQLLRAATLCASEFQVSRDYALRSVGNHLSTALIAANTQLTGWRQGRHLGSISFS